MLTTLCLPLLGVEPGAINIVCHYECLNPAPLRLQNTKWAGQMYKWAGQMYKWAGQMYTTWQCFPISHSKNSQTSQIRPGKRPSMYTMRTARGVEDPGVHDKIRRFIPTQTSQQIAHQSLMLQARPTCSRRVTVVSSDRWNLFGILHSILQNLGKSFPRSRFYC